MTVAAIRVTTREDFRAKVNGYAAQGFQTLRDEGTTITLSRKKPFNWVLAIICLFIPIIGWGALVYMIMAANRSTEVVEVHLEQA